MRLSICKCDICTKEMEPREPIFYKNRKFDICPACAQELVYRYHEYPKLIDPNWDYVVNKFYEESRSSQVGRVNADKDELRTDVTNSEI